MTAAAPLKAFLGPRHWPTWLLLGIFRVLTMLPYSAQLALGRTLGRTAARFSSFRRHVTRTNLEICFPELDDRRRLDLERAAFESFGMGVLETFMAWWWSDRRLCRLGRIEGLEHLRAAQRLGKGVLLVSAHMACLEIGGRLLQPLVRTGFVYREQKGPLLNALWQRRRERFARGGASRQDVRAMLRMLRGGQVLWFAPDQDYGPRHSTFVPFFGVPAATVTSVSWLARLSGASVVPFHNRRLPEGGGYLLRLEPALQAFPGEDEAADARRLNEIFERWIREDPAQYLWGHRRFKTRPPGQLKYYRPKRRRQRSLPGEAGL